MGQYYCRIYKKSQQIISVSDAVPIKNRVHDYLPSFDTYKTTSHADNFQLVTNCRGSALKGRNKLFFASLLLQAIIFEI